MAHTFVHETHNNRGKRLIAVIILLLLFASVVFMAIGNYHYLQGKSTGSFVERYTPDVVHNITPQKQFVLAVLSGIAFFPIPTPIELTFYVGLRQGNNVFLSIAATLFGFMIGNAISYFLGWKLSKHIVYMLSTKKVYGLRRKINKYGVWAIFLTNMTPAPSDLLSFSLGIAKYNTKRLLFYFTIAVLIELSAIAIFVHFVH